MTSGSTHKILRTTTAILPALLIFSSPTIAEEAFEDLGPYGGGHMMHDSQTILSADGTSVAGTDGDYIETRAFRWANGMKTSLGTLGGTNSSASAISADGAVVVGYSSTAGNSERHAFRWVNGNMADLGTLGGTYSYARAVSADGAVVVGNSTTAGDSERHAFRWFNGNMADLGTLGGTYSYANAVSADGAVVVGYSYTTGNSEQRAFRWNDIKGLQSVADWVVEEGGTVPLDYALHNAIGVSADGTIVVGTGRYNNENVAWLARGNGFLRDTAAFDRSVIQTGTAAVSSAMTVTDLALNGAHHRALWEMGFQVTPTGWFGWTTADRAKNDYFDAKTTLLETGIGRDIGEYRIGFAIKKKKIRRKTEKCKKKTESFRNSTTLKEEFSKKVRKKRSK